jgi:hypothetical protein
MKQGDVLWVVSRLSALDRSWPPALVARLDLAEDAWVGPTKRVERKGLPFPYRFGVSLFTHPDGGKFYAANDATRALLDCEYQTPLEPHTSTDDLPCTLGDHVAAWKAASRKGFQSLRRFKDPTALEEFAEHLQTHSVFLSYRWIDHPEHSADREQLAKLTEHLMIDHEVGVWFDGLALPPSKHTPEQRRGVLEMLLGTPLRETPLLVARITPEYGGPSAELTEGSYTLLEWQAARCRFSWRHSPSRYGERLRQFASNTDHRSTDESASSVAEDIRGVLDNGSG